MRYKPNYAPGPTEVRENVRLARAKRANNSDFDKTFIRYYREVSQKMGHVMGTTNEVLLLAGEGILALEAACASLTEPGDRVLVLDNGIYGEGFKDFVSIYGGVPVVLSFDHRSGIPTEAVRAYLEQDSDFKYATLVHCDTPTSVLNNVAELCPLLKEYDILTVVDSVAGMVGEPINVDENKIDICCGGTQKAISAPVGLAIVSVSEDAQKAMDNRKTPIASFYANLQVFKGYVEKEYLPYTTSAGDVAALDTALDNILEEGIETVFGRHNRIASAVREAAQAYGLELFLNSDCSNTVTAIRIPEAIGALHLQEHLSEHYDLLVATSLTQYADVILRIGHMGENAFIDKLVYVLAIIDNGLRDLGFPGQGDLAQLFIESYKQNK
ncbi:pyridoxal-phosphate-dependent aminotransferase family protein [Trichococcus collinsii]|uniref:Aspartate aminotransferase n=1 Tax=Trichococcus collinsii TaxID=157076 RepID=A0AB37ZZM8_9LACT|nr:alanine--glyoxylate aminotransferase family protein [Trichococcus collinsii]CZR06275.1 aminotransferase class-v [Trichococcus collinsii]SEA33025.1 aspartate aminotransferase [Trichococcus collinsii]